jgi:hypothetical protein
MSYFDEEEPERGVLVLCCSAAIRSFSVVLQDKAHG